MLSFYNVAQGRRCDLLFQPFTFLFWPSFLLVEPLIGRPTSRFLYWEYGRKTPVSR